MKQGDVWVECRSDYDYAGRPLAVGWQGVRRSVQRLLEAQRTPQGKRYRVETQDGLLFELIYQEAEDVWEVLPL